MKNEICLLHQSEGANIVFQTVNLPEGIAPSSVNTINSLNEYLIHLTQVTHTFLEIKSIHDMYVIPLKSSDMLCMDMKRSLQNYFGTPNIY